MTRPEAIRRLVKIGLKAGLRMRRSAVDLWLPRLSMMRTSPDFSAAAESARIGSEAFLLRKLILGQRRAKRAKYGHCTYDARLRVSSRLSADQVHTDFEETTCDAADDVDPALMSCTPVSARGDSWQLGRHRLICGDAREHRDIAALMGPDRAAMAFLDPPYNVRGPRCRWPRRNQTSRVLYGLR